MSPESLARTLLLLLLAGWTVCALRQPAQMPLVRHDPGSSTCERSTVTANRSGLQVLIAEGRLDLTHAEVADLDAIPGIGPTLARQIVDAAKAGRLRCHAELAAVPGMGPGRLRRLASVIKPLPHACPSAHPTR